MEFNTTRTKKSYTDEQLEELSAMVDAHNVGKTWENYLIVDVTGSKQVYFTLYRYSQPIASAGLVNPYRYVKNISIDITQSVLKLLKSSKMPILLATQDNFNPLITGFRKRTKEGIPVVPIGKYKGETLDAIWEKDRNWVMWFKKNYKQQSYTNRLGNESYPRLTEEDYILLEQANALSEIFWSDWTAKEIEKNSLIETSYIGEIGKRMTSLEVTITKIKNNEEYRMITAIDSENNELYWYDNSYKIDTSYEKIVIAGTPQKHLEKLAKKTTYINRVKILNILEKRQS